MILDHAKWWNSWILIQRGVEQLISQFWVLVRPFEEIRQLSHSAPFSVSQLVFSQSCSKPSPVESAWWFDVLSVDIPTQVYEFGV